MQNQIHPIQNTNQPVQHQAPQIQNRATPNPIRDLQQQNARLQNELREVRAAKHQQHTTLQSELTSEKERAQNLVQQLREKDGHITELGATITQRNIQARNKDDKMRAKVDLTLSLEQNIGKLKDRIAEMEEKEAEMDYKCLDGYCASCEFFEGEIDDAGEKLKTARAIIANYVADREILVRRNDELQQELNNTHSTIISNAKKHESQVEEMDDEIAVLKTKLQTLAGVQTDLTNTQNVIASNAETHRLEMEELKKQHEISVDMLSASEEKNSKLEEFYATAVSEATKSTEELAALKNEHDETVTNLSIAQNAISEQNKKHNLEMENFKEDSEERFSGMEEQCTTLKTENKTLNVEKESTIVDLAAIKLIITTKTQQHNLEMKVAEEMISGLERTHKDLENGYAKTVAELQKKLTKSTQELDESRTKFTYALNIADSLDQRCTKAEAPFFTLGNISSSFWARSCAFVLLALLFASSLSALDLTFPRALLSYLSPPLVTSLAPVSSIDAISRLQAVVSPLCFETMSIGPDLPSLANNFLPPRTCSHQIVCYILKGWQWVGSHLWWSPHTFPIMYFPSAL